jgi:hypothetical protein
VSEMTGTPPMRGPDAVADVLEELAAADEVTRRRRVHEVVRVLAGCEVGVQQLYRDAVVGAGFVRASDWAALLAEAKRDWQQTRRAASRGSDGRYVAGDDGCLYLADEVGRCLLAKFVPVVVADVCRDDGAERVNVVRVRVTLPGGRVREVDVVAERLHRAREWAARAVGAAALILPGPRAEEHVGTAAQVLGEGKWEAVTEYAHTGWRRIDGYHQFLTASGALGAAGLDPAYQVALGDARLDGYRLPDPDGLEPGQLRAAVRASLELRRLAALPVMAPLLGAAYRAVLPLLPDTSVFVVGPSGSLKTAVSALMCQHFGRGLDSRGLPAEWKSTPNALEVTAHALANVVCVIDDYAPQGADDPRRLAAAADRVLRGVVNSAGRGRLRPDGTPRPVRPPRAQILTTGEDLPPGRSLRARLTIVEFGAGSVDTGRLSTAQELAGDGVYAVAMAGYVQWLARVQDEHPGYRSEMRALIAQLRGRLPAGEHLRTPHAIAGLLAGWREWLRYAATIEAITAGEATRLMTDVGVAMRQVAVEQAAYSRESSPALVYLHALAAALIGGGAHLADQDSGDLPPDNPRRWGWREYTPGQWRPNGTCIGWLSRTGEVYLDPGAAYEVAVAHAVRADIRLATSRTTLNKRLHEGKHLASVDKGHLCVNRRILGRLRRVLHVRAESLHQPDAN